MKNFKRITALVLCAALCGCNSDTQPQEIPETAETTASVAETASAVTTVSETETTTTAATTAAAEAVTEKFPERIYEMSFLELNSSFITGDDYTLSFLGDKKMGSLSYYMMDSERSRLGVRYWNACREPVLMLGDGTPKAAVNAEFVKNIDSPYNIKYDDPILLFGKPEPVMLSTLAKYLPLENIQFGCTVSGGDAPIKARAFFRRMESDKGDYAEFIIDPAYMRGIPAYSKRAKELRFDINGESVYMDSFSVRADGIDAEAVQELPVDTYVYTEIEMEKLGIIYNTSGGYECTAELAGFEVLSDDIKAALDGKFLEMNTDRKDPEMTKTYNALVNSLDTIYKDDTYGIVLLDMDFDGTPEVLVTRSDSFTGAYDETVDVDIYRITGENLKYIDTIQHYDIYVDNIGNTLGLKTLADGTKAWFSTSPVNRKTGEEGSVDYLYTLSGDTLKATEVFGGYYEDYENVESSYFYYFGEKIYPEIEHYELTEEEKQEPYAFELSFNWNGIRAWFGVWELYGFARRDFCDDITETYLLFSPWIAPLVNDYSINVAPEKRVTLSERDAVFNIAYLVDAYYLGEYDAKLEGYSYWFLGAYAKPVIYLYPEEDTDVSVSVDFVNGGEITCSYPEYNGCWSVTAMPDGTLYDESGNEYYCLYWEGQGSAALDRSKGWCVSGKETAVFLREKLLEIGLTAREANEFIIYWLPLMQKNPYNIITFHTEDYAAAVPLNVSPAPDSVIRVFMTFEASDEAVEIQPQELPHYERNGFTLVEWGGAEISE